MKAVVLVAGKGTRMAKHFEGPKHLIPVAGQPVIERALEYLPDVVDGLVVVVGGPHENRMREYFQNEYAGDLPVEFVKQEEQLGLAHAFWQAKELVAGESWIGMVGDDIFGPKGMAEMVKYELAILATRVKNPESFGVLVTDDEGYLVKSVEKPTEFVSDLVWTGAMLMNHRFMETKVEASARGEYETPDVWMEMVLNGLKIKVVEADFWLPVNDKQQLEEAEKVLKEID